MADPDTELDDPSGEATSRPSARFSTLRAEVTGRVGRLTLDQPAHLNPLGTNTLQEIIDAASWFDTTDAVVVIVSGAGRAFSGGFDLRELRDRDAPMSVREQGDLGRRMADSVEAMAALTIAAVRGHCVGGGVILAAACDLRIAADDARFAIPEVDMGMPLTWGGIPRLVREIPPAIVRELILTCRPFDAIEARSFGFVNRVVAAEELTDAADELARQLADKAPSVLRATKRQVNEAVEDMVATSGAWAEADLLGAARADPEARAAARRYLERRGR